jgi:hypothetical protein
LSLATVYSDGGFLDAKWDVMRRHRTSAQSFEDWLLDQLPPGGRVLDVGAGADPVFAYYAATELYRAPMRDESIPLETRLRLAPTYVHLAQQAIDADGSLLVDKQMAAFFCLEH